MKSVAIIGAGITGLTAAFYLKRAGVPVTVFEAGERAGGVIQSLRKDGFLAEFGPNTILETSPKIAQLIRDAEQHGAAGLKRIAAINGQLLHLNRLLDDLDEQNATDAPNLAALRL